MSKTAAAYIQSLGCLSVLGVGPDVIQERLDSGQGFTRQAMPGELHLRDHPSPSAGWIDPIPRPEHLSRAVRFGRLDRLSRLALVAAHQAVEAGRLPRDMERGGIAFGTALGSHLENETFQRLLGDEGLAASPSVFTRTLPSIPAGEMSIHFGLKGAMMTLTEGVGAGVAALALAAQLVESGEMEWMLAGAADVLSATLLAASGPEAGSLSEGAAFFTITSGTIADAHVRPLCRVAGWAQGFEADVDDMMHEALWRAGISPRQVRSRVSCPDAALEQAIGRSQAAAPLLGLCAVMARGELPALVTVKDPEGPVLALCVA